MEVLIAEDSEHIAKRYEKILSDVVIDVNGSAKIDTSTVNVVITASYKDFKKRKLDENHYDLAILDWKLIGSTAKDILKMLDSKYVAVITGYADESHIQKTCEKYKVNRLMDKFIGLHTVEDLIKEALNVIQT